MSEDYIKDLRVRAEEFGEQTADLVVKVLQGAKRYADQCNVMLREDLREIAAYYVGDDNEFIDEMMDKFLDKINNPRRPQPPVKD